MQSRPTIRLAELMACLSVATDLGMGQPMDHAMTTCLIAVRLGEALGFDALMLRDAYYESLLRYVGCNADTYWLASLAGDELALRAEVAKVDSADLDALVALMLRFVQTANAGLDATRMSQVVANAMAQLPTFNTSFFPGHCEVAQRLATRMAFDERFVQTVGQIYARWDGKGVPALRGEEISPALLCASLAQDAVTFYRLGGVDAAITMAKSRSGAAHAPHMVAVFCAQAHTLFAGLERELTWDAVLRMEPGEQLTLNDAELDAAFEAMADYTDIKSPWFLNHSRRVADLAERAGAKAGMAPDDCQSLRRAACIHDIGKVGVSAGIWGKPGALTEREQEQVRLHPYYTGRVFARSEHLTRLGALAALHHERLDGSGYHRNLPASMITPAARILCAANAYQALLEARPHRAALSPEQAAGRLLADVQSNKLDGDAVNAVLSVAGHALSAARHTPGDLSEREVEVLRLLARGSTMKDVATQLVISYKTVDRHVQNIYTKIGVNTRAGATLWAMEHALM